MLSTRSKLQWAEREMQLKTQLECFLMSIGSEKASTSHNKVIAPCVIFNVYVPSNRAICHCTFEFIQFTKLYGKKDLVKELLNQNKSSPCAKEFTALLKIMSKGRNRRQRQPTSDKPQQAHCTPKKKTRSAAFRADLPATPANKRPRRLKKGEKKKTIEIKTDIRRSARIQNCRKKADKSEFLASPKLLVSAREDRFGHVGYLNVNEYLRYFLLF